jgi:hypothetical protein
MRVRAILAIVITPLLGAVVVAPRADSADSADRGAERVSAATGHGATITQGFHCTTPVGDIDEDIQVDGNALDGGRGKLLLTGVTFAFLNNFGVDVTIDKIRFWVPDPNQDSAPYKPGSASVSEQPKGWRAGHKGAGLFEYFAGTQVLADGATLEVPSLGAAYRNRGPRGTVIKWKPGEFSFNVESPDPGLIDCTPVKPIQTFASIKE